MYFYYTQWDNYHIFQPTCGLQFAGRQLVLRTAPDLREYPHHVFSYFSMKIYVVGTH